LGHFYVFPNFFRETVPSKRIVACDVWRHAAKSRHQARNLMLCISILQPWATLWLLKGPDEKWFETRSWRRSYIGPLLVHAGRRRDTRVANAVRDFAPILEKHDIHGIDDLDFGALIGRVDLIGCCQMSKMQDPCERERKVGFWHPDRFAWERAANPHRFARPIPYRGWLGLFDVPEEVRRSSWTL
jgi:activating signal cointegrator 1